ncbi:MAG: ParB/RepB/Spo0J family partition protein [Chloroflexi bacterium]|nr:ParB/RepB/Spo0J family partition protein [Chloroflexota bacterium]
MLLPVDEVAPNPHNPRQHFSEEAINELAESILAWGQLQPIVVRRVNEHYEIICGERRWRAHQRADLPKIWAVERTASDAEAYKLALIENLHRVDLSHAEKIAALDQLGELTAVSGLRKTASEIKVSPGWLSTQLSLRQDPVIFPALEAGQVSFAQAAELRRAPAPARRNLLDRTIRERVPFSTVRTWVQETRQMERQAQAGIGASLAAGDSKTETSAPNDGPYSAALTHLQGLGQPASASDRRVVRRII